MQDAHYERLRNHTREGDTEAAEALIHEAVRRSDSAGQIEALIALEHTRDPPNDPARASLQLWEALHPLLNAWPCTDNASLDDMVAWLELELQRLSWLHRTWVTPPHWTRAIYRGRGRPYLRLCRTLQLVPPGKFPPWKLDRQLDRLIACPHLHHISSLCVHFDPARNAPLVDASVLQRLASWSRLPRLTHIELPRQHLDDTPLLTLTTLPLHDLQHLDLRWNLIGDPGLHTLLDASNLPALTTLSLAGNRDIRQAAERLLEGTGALTQLVLLDLSNCGIYSYEVLQFLQEHTQPRYRVDGNPGWDLQRRILASGVDVTDEDLFEDTWE